MFKCEIARGPNGRVLLIDSITQLEASHAGAIVVSGSHGGASSGEVALRFPLRAVFFNDAGVGKDNAGIVALAMLQQRGVVCAAVSHSSARIGDALDAWQHGVLSHLNDAALACGMRRGDLLQAALAPLLR